MNRIALRALAFGVALTFVAIAPAHEAEASPFAGKVITSNKRLPISAKSKKAYYAKIRKQTRTKFALDAKTQQWKIYYGAWFRRPLQELEVTIKLYDVTEKKNKVLKLAFEQYLDQRGQKEIISYIKLDRDKFGVNRRILMTVENRGKKLAQGIFQILDAPGATPEKTAPKK